MDKIESRAILPAILGAVIHAVLWLGLLAWLAVFAGGYTTHVLRTFHMQVPVATQQVLSVTRFFQLYWYLCVPGLIVVLAADGLLLYRLDRSPLKRALRELWSGLMVLVPVACFAWSAVVLMLPYLKLTEGLMRSSTDYEKAVAGERQRLSGRWKLAGGERAGKPIPAAELPAWTLVFEDDHYRWTKEKGETGGTYGFSLRHKPLHINFFPTSGPDAGMMQPALYRLTGDRLTLCLPPAGAFGEDLPEDFATRGTKNELWVWQRAQ